jgi:hypothetical protein
MASSLNFQAGINLDAGIESAVAFATDDENSLQERFYCRLDDQPDHLVPERYLRGELREGLAGRPLLLNPRCQFVRRGTLPDSVRPLSPWLENFDLRPDTIWIAPPGGGVQLPFWLGAEFGNVVAGMQPGDRAPATLSARGRQVLAMAGVLVPFDGLSNRVPHWEQDIAECRGKFREKNYVPVGGLIHPFHISALRRYYRSLVRGGKLKLGDCQTSRRYVAYNESVLRFFHHQLRCTVGAIVGEPVKPSYVYLGSYQSGAELAAHTDREQCEFTMSLCLDFSPEPVRETPWPLHLHTSAGKTTVFQGIGDALIYCGTKIPHSRDPLPPGHTSTSIFFHYVAETFTGKLD